MKLTNNYEIGQIVYLVTDPEQLDRMVIGVLMRSDGISYELASGNSLSWHYDCEIAEEKDILKTLTNEAN